MSALLRCSIEGDDDFDRDGKKGSMLFGTVFPDGTSSGYAGKWRLEAPRAKGVAAFTWAFELVNIHGLTTCCQFDMANLKVRRLRIGFYIGMYRNLGINKRRHDYCFSFSVSSGTFSKRSPTRPTSATWKIGASASLLIAAMTLLSFMPAKCWIAPEIPAQR